MITMARVVSSMDRDAQRFDRPQVDHLGHDSFCCHARNLTSTKLLD